MTLPFFMQQACDRDSSIKWSFFWSSSLLKTQSLYRELLMA